MRISDWSSDVCSSDLDADRAAEVETLDFLLGDDVDHTRDRVGAIGRRRTVAQHLDAVDDGVVDGVEVDEVALAVIRERIARHAQAVRNRQRRLHGQDAQRRGVRTRSEVEAAVPSLRSEEHTYELQPLMRISYAYLSL